MTTDAIRCVVFDVDDTLYLERDYVRSGFDAVGAWLQRDSGVAGFSDQAWRIFCAGGRGNVFDLALSALGVPACDSLVHQLVQVYRTHEPRIELLPDAQACLQSLHGRTTMAIVTDGPAASQRAKIKALRLEEWMHTLVCTAELGEGRGKPDPLAFEIIERRTGAAGAACVYVADNPGKDFGGPISLGWKTVRIRREQGLHARLETPQDVDAELSQLSDLVRWYEG